MAQKNDPLEGLDSRERKLYHYLQRLMGNLQRQIEKGKSNGSDTKPLSDKFDMMYENWDYIDNAFGFDWVSKSLQKEVELYTWSEKYKNDGYDYPAREAEYKQKVATATQIINYMEKIR